MAIFLYPQYFKDSPAFVFVWIYLNICFPPLATMKEGTNACFHLWIPQHSYLVFKGICANIKNQLMNESILTWPPSSSYQGSYSVSKSHTSTSLYMSFFPLPLVYNSLLDIILFGLSWDQSSYFSPIPLCFLLSGILCRLLIFSGWLNFESLRAVSCTFSLPR